MCELLLMAANEPFPLGPVLRMAEQVEQAGEAGHGWGVAWLRGPGNPLALHKQPGPLNGDPTAAGLAGEIAVAALIHMRMPTDMSTVGMPDTQPFLDPEAGVAFAHNGYLAAHNTWRPRYAGILAGRADSEVGFAHFRILVPTLGVEGALRKVFDETGGAKGFANLAVLERIGALHMYCANGTNRVAMLRDGRFSGFVTTLHKHDTGPISAIFPRADLTLVPVGEHRTIGRVPTTP